jgi:hypothetical protein
MFNRLGVWWRWEARYLHKDFIYGLKNLYKWFPTIWRDRDWDHDFIYNLLAKKLEFQAKFIGDRGFHTRAKRDAECMQLVVKLIKLVQDDFYNMEYMEYTEDLHWFEPCVELAGYSTWESKILWEKYDQYFEKYPVWHKRAIQHIKDNQDQFSSGLENKQLVAMVMGDLRQTKCQELIFKLMNQNINKWWD